MAKPFERSEQTTRMINYLRPFDKGTLVTYDELSEVAGVIITSESSELRTMRQTLERIHKAIWCCEKPRIGLRRLKDAEIAERHSQFYMNGARNKLKRGGSQADVVDYKQLDIDEQAKFATDSIQREIASEALSKATRRKMEKVARGTSQDLPAFNVVEWAISLSPRRKEK